MSKRLGPAMEYRFARIAAVLLLATVGLSPLSGQTLGITGTVKSATGQPISGALVKVKGDGQEIAFMVVSQTEGRFTTPALPPGRYQVQTFAGDKQGVATAPVEVKNTGAAKIDLILSNPLEVKPLLRRLTDDDYGKMMPASDPEEIRQIAISDCKECHTLRWVVAGRKSKEKWEQTVNRMYHDLLGRRMPLWFALKDDEFVGGKRFGQLIDYLAKNFGEKTPIDTRALEPWTLPGSASHPNRNLPSSLLSGIAARYAAMEFTLPQGAVASAIAINSRGIAWVTEMNTGMLGRFDPASNSYTRISVPAGKTVNFQLDSVTVDPQDNVWFVDDGPNARILEYNSQTNEFSTFPIPEYRWAVPDAGPARIAALRFVGGNVWGTRLTAQKILELNPRTRKVTEYPIPRGASPYGLAAGGDGGLWYAAEVGNVVVRLKPDTGEIVPYDMPTERSDLHGMSIDAEGNLWVAATEAGKLIKVDGHTGKATEFTPPGVDAGPWSVDVDTKRNVIWFNEMFADRIARFDPAANAFAEFPLPSADLDVRRMEIDQSHPDRVWWCGGIAGKIGYLDLTP